MPLQCRNAKFNLSHTLEAAVKAGQNDTQTSSQRNLSCFRFWSVDNQTKSYNRDFSVSEIKDKSIQQFLDELASKAPTPGGGSAAAIMGAQSAALTSMVCNLTIGKPKYAEVEIDMQTLLQKSEALREELTGMIQADIDVFNRLMATYALPKETDGQKTLRSAAIQKALVEATEIPLACARACAAAVELSRIAADKGNSAAVSDAGVAVMAAYSGLKSAALNVYINAGSLKDRDFADAKLTELKTILNGIDVDAEEIYQLVKNKL
jgi:methenyltetrahydrofolate cyclohydrolase